MNARKTKDRLGKIVWICNCGSQLEARYNKKREYAKSDQDRVCTWCRKESGRGK